MLYRLRKLRLDIFYFIKTETIRARHLAPNEKSQFIGVVIKIRIFYFLVFTRAVESHRLARLYISFQGFRGGRREIAFFPIPLIENEFLIQRRVIQKD